MSTNFPVTMEKSTYVHMYVVRIMYYIPCITYMYFITLLIICEIKCFTKTLTKYQK